MDKKSRVIATAHGTAQTEPAHRRCPAGRAALGDLRPTICGGLAHAERSDKPCQNFCPPELI
jgi:hypothetical protein